MVWRVSAGRVGRFAHGLRERPAIIHVAGCSFRRRAALL
ncbi:hypothetical protein LG3211_0256 [Lysobacter gummosus]|nr:hypothetical protein LG3211_0256 [Lysobacter gummosus]